MAFGELSWSHDSLMNIYGNDAIANRTCYIDPLFYLGRAHQTTTTAVHEAEMMLTMLLDSRLKPDPGTERTTSSSSLGLSD